MPDILAELDDLIVDLDKANPSAEHLNQIYALFEQHFIRDGVLINGRRLKIHLKKSNIPRFKGKPETFVHIVTRERAKPGLRDFDKDRANKVHWIKPILLQAADSRIYVFDKAHDKTDSPQQYFWFKSKGFVVVLRNYHADHILITAFCVEERKAKQFERWHKQGECHKKPHLVCGARSLGTAIE